MKELRWMDLPRGCKRTSTSITVPVPRNTLQDDTLQSMLCMLAVSDEDFTFRCSAPIVPEDDAKARCGIVIFQDPGNWMWASANKSEGHISISSNLSTCSHKDWISFPVTTEEQRMSWSIVRSGKVLQVFYNGDGTDRLVRRFSLPSSAGSVSFGLATANATDRTFTVSFCDLAYVPAKTSSATTALE